MVTITPEAVRLVISTALADISTPITAAETLVNELLTSTNQSASVLNLIGVYLAAHYVAVQDPRPQSERLGDASTTYQGATGTGLMATSYGQTAIQLDASGTLARSQKPKATLICA